MRTLILNADFRPLSTVNAKRGLSLALNSPNVSVLEQYDTVIRSEKQSFRLPAVMLYNKFVKLPERKKPNQEAYL